MFLDFVLYETFLRFCQIKNVIILKKWIVVRYGFFIDLRTKQKRTGCGSATLLKRKAVSSGKSKDRSITDGVVMGDAAATSEFKTRIHQGSRPQLPFINLRPGADSTAVPRVFHHAAKRKHGALRCGITGNAQPGKSFMDMSNFPGGAPIVTGKDRLVRMIAE